MPIFEYRCRECSRVFELLVRGTDGESLECPECGSGELKRLFSLFASRSDPPAARVPAATGGPAAMMRQGGGGCCGGGCGCH